MRSKMRPSLLEDLENVGANKKLSERFFLTVFCGRKRVSRTFPSSLRFLAVSCFTICEKKFGFDVYVYIFLYELGTLLSHF